MGHYFALPFSFFSGFTPQLPFPYLLSEQKVFRVFLLKKFARFMTFLLI